MNKYLVEIGEDYNHTIVERFYFDTLDELYDWLNNNKDTMFNYGLNSKEIHLYDLEKGNSDK